MWDYNDFYKPQPDMPRPDIYSSWTTFDRWSYRPEDKEYGKVQQRERFWDRARRLLADGGHYATHFELYEGDHVIYGYGYVLFLDRRDATKIGDKVYVSNDPRIRDIRGQDYIVSAAYDGSDTPAQVVFAKQIVNMRDGFTVQDTGNRTFELKTAHWRNGRGVRYLELVSIHGYGFEVKPDDILLEDANQQGAGEHDIELEN